MPEYEGQDPIFSEDPEYAQDIENAVGNHAGRIADAVKFMATATALAGTHAVLKELTGKQESKLQKATTRGLRAEINAKSQQGTLSLDQFTWRGYAQGYATDYIMGGVKDILIDYFSKEELDKFVEVSPVEITKVTTDIIPLGDLDKTNEIDPMTLRSFLTEEDLAFLEQRKEELTQYGRCADPQREENLAFRNSQMIEEKVSSFGFVEGDKQSTLDAFYGTGVLIPWEIADDDACEDCQILADEGPYPPEEYPEPPHYGCRCEPGQPVPAQAFLAAIKRGVRWIKQLFK